MPNGLVKLSQYEVINFKGWFGLLLAVQQSPVVVNIEASEDSFVNYVAVSSDRVNVLTFCVFASTHQMVMHHTLQMGESNILIQDS